MEKFKIILLCFILLIAPGCKKEVRITKLQIEKDNNYPRWLKSRDNQTDQTSGNVYIGRDGRGLKTFLLADDIGKIHHLKIEDDTVFHLSTVYLGDDVRNYLKDFPKGDFEEITYDKYTGSVYLSIEGDGPDYNKFVGIYKIIFKNNDIFADTLTGIVKMNFSPASLFYKYTRDNIGYEGLAVDRNYFYLGLEGFEDEGVFADSTLIFIGDKNSLKIIKEIDTKPYNIFTACGLYSDRDNSIFGIDRNAKKIFHIKFNKDLDVESVEETNLKSAIPSYPLFSYVASLESITIDDENNIYLVDDPWKAYFIPSDDVLKKLDENTVQNFKDFVPVIFKYKLIK